MILTLLMLQAAVTAYDPVPLGATRTLGAIDADRFNRCHDMAVEDPAQGVAEALRWIGQGGGFIARQCLGFAQTRAGQFVAAANSFAQAASDAEIAHDWRAANLWAQAGNAALAGGDAATARRYLDAALAQGRLTGLQLGEAHLDRARAALVESDWAAARTDLDHAKTDAGQDPLTWLLSATLARRMDNLPLAQADIATAAALGPRDPAIALEAGNIAATGGQMDAARRNWENAATLGAGSAIADTARARLEELAAWEAQQPAAAPPSATSPEATQPPPDQSR